MAKKFGLSDLEALGLEVGGINDQMVSIARVVSAILKAPFTVESEAEEQVKSLGDEIVRLEAVAQTIELTAAESAKALREESVRVEEQGKNSAGIRRGTAARWAERRAEVLKIIGQLKKT